MLVVESHLRVSEGAGRVLATAATADVHKRQFAQHYAAQRMIGRPVSSRSFGVLVSIVVLLTASPLDPGYRIAWLLRQVL